MTDLMNTNGPESVNDREFAQFAYPGRPRRGFFECTYPLSSSGKVDFNDIPHFAGNKNELC